MNRRNFIKISSTATGGLAITIAVPTFGSEVPDNKSFSPNVLTEIHADGSISFMLTKHEMGQGTGTGVPMVFCDELGGNWNTLKVIQADHNPGKYKRLQGNTGGSSGLRSMWMPMRQMGAVTREVLKQAAAQKWGIDKGGLETENGFVVQRATGKKINFGELIDVVATITPPAAADVKLKDPAAFKLIGKSVKNLTTAKVVKGEKHYALDLTRPGMVHASIERSPVYRGKVKSVNDSAARAVKGVIDIVRVPEIFEGTDFIVREGVAVIANSTWAAMQGRKFLEITWDEGINGSTSNEQLRNLMISESKKPGEKVHDYYGNFGDVNTALAEADEIMTANYENPYHAHACMEPMNGIAEVKDGRIEVWATMQNPDSASRKIADHVGFAPGQQTIHILPAGGSFGRKFYPEHVTEVAYLAKEVGKPVKLTWTREDDIRCDYNSAFQQDHHKVAIRGGEVTGWYTNVVSTQGWSPEPWFPYLVPNKRGEKIIVNTPLTIGAWRSVGPHRAGFATEGMMDEIAHKLGKDPLQFRLSMLNRELELSEDAARHYNQPYSKDAIAKTTQVLKLAADKANWGKTMPKGSGQGIAVYRFSNSFCAQVAEVTVSGGSVKVDKVTAVLYCGTVVNPHFVKGQVEGAIVWALTSVLYGGMTFENGKVQQSNFHDYKMLRMKDVPQIEVHLVPSADPATGVGEPAVPPCTPAIMNAIYAATGKRIRKTPVTAKDLV